MRPNLNAAGNLCTVDLVLICRDMGIEAGINLETLIECVRRAEDIVGLCRGRQ